MQVAVCRPQTDDSSIKLLIGPALDFGASLLPISHTAHTFWRLPMQPFPSLFFLLPSSMYSVCVLVLVPLPCLPPHACPVLSACIAINGRCNVGNHFVELFVWSATQCRETDPGQLCRLLHCSGHADLCRVPNLLMLLLSSSLVSERRTACTQTRTHVEKHSPFAYTVPIAKWRHLVSDVPSVMSSIQRSVRALEL